ncbi:carboxyltransferase domain-containing protein, partial [Clostridioides difficile]
FGVVESSKVASDLISPVNGEVLEVNEKLEDEPECINEDPYENERIATPRLEVPRTKIYGGSVGIAGSQTGVYPIDSPGGWQIIG